MPRKRPNKVGVLAYTLRDDEELITIGEDGTLTVNRSLLRRVHPGIGTLTTLPVIASRVDDLGKVQFESEYGCRFPDFAGSQAIDQQAWKDCAGGEVLPARPARPGLAFDVEPDGTYAALVAAWRDEDQLAHLELLAFRPGYDWLPAQARNAGRKHRVQVAHDAIGINLDVAQSLSRLRTATAPIQLRYMQAATARLNRAIETRQLRHYEQPDLTESVKGAVWRTIGDTARLFGRANAESSACPIVASAVALWQYDQTAKRPGVAGAITSEENP